MDTVILKGPNLLRNLMRACTSEVSMCWLCMPPQTLSRLPSFSEYEQRSLEKIQEVTLAGLGGVPGKMRFYNE